MMDRLTWLEARVEALIEGSFARLLGGRMRARDLAVPLARALEDSAAHGAPAVTYTLRLHPVDAQMLLEEQPRLAESLADEILALAREAGLTLAHRPEVNWLADPAIARRAVEVVTGAPAADAGHTQGMTPPQPGEVPPPPPAFLILGGERTLPLNQAVLSLGRRLDNHIILDDPRVSRTHAQIRLRYGRYVLYDLGSQAGTLVNGQQVSECVLRPGDVITLGDTAIIYGEEDLPPAPPSPPGSGQAAAGGTRPQLPADTRMP